MPPPLVLATASNWPITEKSCTEMTELAVPEDLSPSIKGMYRLLDLITEQGSDGLGEHLPVAVGITLTAPPKLIRL
jgi:hypothetical protein